MEHCDERDQHFNYCSYGSIGFVYLLANETKF